MPSLNDLRAALHLPPAVPDRPLPSLDDALRGCPERAAREVVQAAGVLAARALRPQADVTLLLGALQDAVMSPHPERSLVELVAAWTGGLAEMRASWGDLIATSGRAAGPAITQRLAYRERHVGALTLAAPPGWQALLPVVTPYALLARLHAAAAGAARRRVGERVLEAFLSGADRPELGREPFAVAVAAIAPPGRAALGVAAREDALDVLAGVGEGYLSGRQLRGYSTVRAGQAVWLWSTLNLSSEGRELHEALVASTEQDVRVGLSARHVLDAQGAASAVQDAYAQARQALDATRSARGFTTFQGMDPLFALLSGGQLQALRAQVAAQLGALEDDGRSEATLRAYVAHSGSLAALAAAQGVHVNTVRYRLRRAEDALGARLDDPSLLARLYLAFA